jgi:hypothetical protein
MMKKYLESPNTGRVTNERVYNQYLKSLNYNDVVLENIRDSFNLKAGDFGMLEKTSLCSNLEKFEKLRTTLKPKRMSSKKEKRDLSRLNPRPI